MALSEGGRLTQWTQLSEYVHRARLGRDPIAANGLLRSTIQGNPDDPLAATFLYWSSENSVYAARFADAITALEELLTRHGRKPAAGSSWGSLALERLATCYERSGDWQDAFRSYERIDREFPEAPGATWRQYQAGRAAQLAGQESIAEAAYERVAQANDESDAFAELARREVARLRNPGRVFSSAEALASELSRALRSQDLSALLKMASPTHFAIGASELAFARMDVIGDDLRRDLAVGPVFADPLTLECSGFRGSLMTHGWCGSRLIGDVPLFLGRSASGWQWVGIAVPPTCSHEPHGDPGHQRPKEPKTSDPPIPAGSPPDVFNLKSPWPRGQDMRAGGINRFIASKLFPPIALFDQFTTCGYGPYGLYYNTGPTHVGVNKFAIDFTRYQQGAPYLSLVASMPALAAHHGVVPVRPVDLYNFGSYNNTGGNMVTLDWLTNAEMNSFLATGVLPPGRFRTMYLHLDRPIFVSLHMDVPQGTRLAFMDSTGNSAMPHLHFSLHLRDLGYISISLDGMDGNKLGDGNDAQSCSSSNTPVP
jgi:hypothetical protein